VIVGAWVVLMGLASGSLGRICVRPQEMLGGGFLDWIGGLGVQSFFSCHEGSMAEQGISPVSL